MRYFYFFAMLLLPGLFSCCKPEECENCPPPQDTTANNATLKVLWQIPLNPDTAECVSMRPIVYNGNVLYSLRFYIDGFEFLRMVDAKTGAPKWSWDPLWPGETSSRGSRYAKDNVLLLTHWGPYYGIDLNTGQNIWAQKVEENNSLGDNRMNLIGDYIYSEHSARLIVDTTSALVRADIYSGKWDTLLVKKMDAGYSPYLLPPSLWVSPQGDSILIMQNRQWNFPNSDGRVDLLALNLKTHEVIWEVKDFDTVGNSSVEPPFIYENKVYVLAEKTMYCFDAATGVINWHWNVPQSYDNLMFTNIIAAEGKLFVKPSIERKLYGFNPNTGAVVANIATGSGSVEMTYYNGIIYYTSQGDGYIYAIKPSTGEMIWHYGSPNRNKPGATAGNATFDEVTVSPEHGCVFVGDRFYFMAIELPK